MLGVWVRQTWILCLLCYSKYTPCLILVSPLLLLPAWILCFLCYSQITPCLVFVSPLFLLPAWILCLLCYSQSTHCLDFVSPLLFKLYSLPDFSVSFVTTPCLDFVSPLLFTVYPLPGFCVSFVIHSVLPAWFREVHVIISLYSINYLHFLIAMRRVSRTDFIRIICINYRLKKTFFCLELDCLHPVVDM